MICSEVQQLIPDLLLGELNTEDETSVRAHLSEGCKVCAELMVETESTFGLLLDAIPPEAPSPELAERLAARIESEPVATSSVARIVREHDWIITVVSTIAAAILAMVGSWALFSATHSDETAELRRLQIAVAKRKDQIGALRRELQDDAGFAAAMRSPELYVLNFTGAPDTESSARALWDAAGRRLCVAFSKLPQPKDGQVLSVWCNADRLTEFNVTAQGDAAFTVEIPADIRPEAVVVSLDASNAASPQQQVLVAQISDAIRLAANERAANMLVAR